MKITAPAGRKVTVVTQEKRNGTDLSVDIHDADAEFELAEEDDRQYVVTFGPADDAKSEVADPTPDDAK